MTSCSGQEVPIPGVPKTIFLEDLVVRDTALNTFAKVIDGRGRRRRWNCSVRRWLRLSAPRLEGVMVKIQPMGNSCRGLLMEPAREEGVDFLNLDEGKLMNFIAKRICGKVNESIVTRINGNAV